MAFPQTAAPAETSFSSDSTTHNVSMPATVNSGDLLIILFGRMNTGDISTTPSGWTRQISEGDLAFARNEVYLKVADGTEGGTTVNIATSSAVAGSAQAYRVTDWFGALAGVETSTVFENSVTDPDPPSLSPSWGSADTLWFAIFIYSNDDGTVSAYPTSYTGGVDTLTGGAANNNCAIGSARRENATATEDPGVFTLSTAERGTAITLAVRPSSGSIAPAYHHLRNLMGA